MADAAPATVDREARKKAEKEAKALKAAEKAARQAQRASAQQQKGAEVIGPSVTLIDWEGHDFGNLFIQSHAVPAREGRLVRFDGAWVHGVPRPACEYLGEGDLGLRFAAKVPS